jgi:ribosomal protein L37E
MQRSYAISVFFLSFFPAALRIDGKIKVIFVIHVTGKMSWSGGDWMCNACQHINFKKRDACQNCGYPKIGGPDPDTYRYNWTEKLAGDWYCSGMNCGAHNYASRTSCYRCGALKNGYSCGFGGNMEASGGYGSDCNYPPGWKTGDWICTRSVPIIIITYFLT